MIHYALFYKMEIYQGFLQLSMQHFLLKQLPHQFMPAFFDL